MKSRRNQRFRKLFDALPDNIQKQAYAAYQKFRTNPYHASLQFKQVSNTEPLYSVRIGDHYRALGLRQEDDLIVWIWIGSHEDYNNRV